MAKSFEALLMGAAGGGVELPSDDEFNTVSFLSHFDGDNNGVNNVFDDSSTSNHTITANGDVTQGSFGPFARSDGYWGVSFDGSDGLSSSASTDYEFGTGDLTVEYWAFPTASGTVQNIIDNRAEASGWKLGRDASNQFQVYNEVTSSYLFESGTFPEGEWTHFCWTRASGVNKFFINGVQSGSDVSDSSNFNSNSLNIGVQHAGDTQFFTGTIASVRVIKGTAVEPSGLPTSPPTAVTNTKLLTCQSNRFVDNSTSDHTITTIGNPAVSAFGPFLTRKVYDAGVNGASAYFDGTGDYLNTPSNSDFNLSSGDWTIDGWVNNKVIAANNRVFSIEGGSNTYSLIRPNTDPKFDYNHVGSGSLIATSNNISFAGEWTHFALVSNSGTITLWINGVSQGTTTTYPDNSDTQITVAASAVRFQTSNTDGYISNFRVVNGTAIYTSAFTPPTAPLTAVTNTKLLLNMADGQAIDSAAQNNLTLYGNAKVSNTQAKFGGTSLYLDGTGDYAVLNDSDAWAFGTGDFTVETWLYLDGTPGTFDYIFDMRNTSQTEYTWALSFNYMNTTTDKLQWASNNTTPNAILTADYPSLNQWVHIAICRSGTTTRMFYDGTQSAINTSDSADYRNTGHEGYIGCRHSVESFINAYYDDIRFSKFARYTANFTPPTETFADKGR